MHYLAHTCKGLELLVKKGFIRVTYPDIDNKGPALLVELVGPGKHEFQGKEVPDTITISNCPLCGERFYWGPTRFEEGDDKCYIREVDDELHESAF